jgi:predicted kinase
VYDKGIFKAMFFAGLPGAGKSYTLNKITDGSIEPRIVNFDKYAEFLGKQHNIPDVGAYSEDWFIDKSKTMTISQLAVYINSMLPMFIDSTSNKMNRVLYREGLLRFFGYDSGMIYINTPLEVAMERAKKRNRSVPESFIKSVYRSMQENIDYYRTHFDLFVEIQNGDGELTNDAILQAYRKVSSFFKEDIKNPVGKRNKEKAEKHGGYLTPSVYTDISHIKSKLINWY